ncbi:hypothetical protein A4G99_03705 [Haladaptatus sp. R4]|nr:hypothetical protein A4G99_03705 [Haladaptatus sp. R4]
MLQYTTTPLAFVLILVPVCYASWLLRNVEATYELRGSLRVGGWHHGQSFTVGLLVLGAVVSVWYVLVLLAYPPFVGGRNTLSHFVGVTVG